MCLIVFAWSPDTPQRLLLAANRDEFHARPTRPLDVWAGLPWLIAGQDLESGGTWLGFTRNGRFAALTNFRDPARARAAARSRGRLVLDFLAGQREARAYARDAAAVAAGYNGFNLLLGDGRALWWVGHRNGEAPAVACLPPGIHAVSNHRPGTPWPKLVLARDGLGDIMRTCRSGGPQYEALFRMLLDRRPASDEALPDTGVGLERERQLSSVFVVGEEYGTRCSTIAEISDGRLYVEERRFSPDGGVSGRTRVDLPVAGM
ncbi:NRDE family protein [Methyloversatilis thermotolerans]|uniref:NRDE family protein n=1 Tax=Methyloversatilis thermotolerans TaxID=1346290 RepID=UPI00038230B1|nr:NRDE family protein [Methyloversatilis thermotolerans]